MKDKKILIVGGAGYIGGYLTDRLDRMVDNYPICVYDNIMYESRYFKPVNFVYGDIRERDKLSKIINDYDTVIWLAAIVGDGACAVDPGLTNDINYESVKWLVDNYKGKIVFTSTCSVYGVNHELITESATPNPLSVYAETKLKAEQYIINNHNNYLIFRLGTLFGLGDYHSRIRLDLVTNILTLNAVKGKVLSVYGGEQWRPLLHVKDVTNAIIYGLEHNINGLYNLSYKNFTIRQIAETIQQVVPNTNVKYTDLSFEDQRNYMVSCDKIKALGWAPEFDLLHGIREVKNIIIDKRVTNPDDIVYSNASYVRRFINEYTRI